MTSVCIRRREEEEFWWCAHVNEGCLQCVQVDEGWIWVGLYSLPGSSFGYESSHCQLLHDAPGMFGILRNNNKMWIAVQM